jgi:RNA polymerase sigma factor (sigma-70 family)
MIDRPETVDHSVNLSERRSSLLRFVRSRVNDTEVAEDLVQDVLYQFLRSADARVAIEDATAWLFRAARNRIIDWYRRRKSDEARPAEDADPIATEPRSDPARTVESAELWDAFLAALDELPEDQREVFILHELEGVPFSQIAEMTGIKLNTLLSRKRYAALALRRKLNLFR